MGSAPHKISGLLIAVGFLLLISALPSGIVFSFVEHLTVPQDWRAGIISGVGIFVASALVALILVGVGEFHARRSAKVTRTP